MNSTQVNGGNGGKQEQDHGHIVPSNRSGWQDVADNRADQDILADDFLALIRRKTTELYTAGTIKHEKFTNDPQVFPLGERSLQRANTAGHTGLVPFPPNDQQYYICGTYYPMESYLTPSAKPGHDMYTDNEGETKNSSWVRLCDFAEHDGVVHLFKQPGQKANHMGRVMQGALDNGYLVEALNAVSLRPKLVEHLFHGYDVAKSIYTVRLFKHGWWGRMELDDYVPVSPPPDGKEVLENRGPICCVSEHFPMVMWPSLVEKAYAKFTTHRELLTGASEQDAGGWEAIGAGGRVEDALVLLTGGVAGRFRTREVSADRLFIYLYEHQGDTLFVCRVNEPACELYGVRLNPYFAYAVNRAATWEGRLFVQVFCAAPTCFDGGLQDMNVPYALTHCEEYPEREDEGFFWCDVNDFHLYFDTIFECHLVNSPSCEIPGMPPPRLPPPMPFTSMPMQQMKSPPSGKGSFNNPFGDPAPGMGKGPNGYMGGGKGFEGKGWDGGKGQQQQSQLAPSVVLKGSQSPWFNRTLSTRGAISKHNAPEFHITIQDCPENGCELLCSLDQYDSRVQMTTPALQRPAQIRLKAYVVVNDMITASGGQKGLYQLVCKSNWLPINHSMVGIHIRHACKIEIIAQFPDGAHSESEMSVFRAYCTAPNFQLSGKVHTRGDLGNPPEGEQPAAVKWSLVGCVDEALMDEPDMPTEFDPATDGLRKSAQDENHSLEELKKECAVM